MRGRIAAGAALALLLAGCTTPAPEDPGGQAPGTEETGEASPSSAPPADLLDCEDVEAALPVADVYQASLGSPEFVAAPDPNTPSAMTVPDAGGLSCGWASADEGAARTNHLAVEVLPGAGSAVTEWVDDMSQTTLDEAADDQIAEVAGVRSLVLCDASHCVVAGDQDGAWVRVEYYDLSDYPGDMTAETHERVRALAESFFALLAGTPAEKRAWPVTEVEGEPVDCAALLEPAGVDDAEAVGQSMYTSIGEEALHALGLVDCTLGDGRLTVMPGLTHLAEAPLESVGGYYEEAELEGLAADDVAYAYCVHEDSPEIRSCALHFTFDGVLYDLSGNAEYDRAGLREIAEAIIASR